MYASVTPSAVPDGFSTGRNVLGDVYYRDEYFPVDYRQGKVAVGEALSLHPEFIDRLGDDVTQDGLTNAAYVDIETTGSALAGNRAFLVGVGTFDALAFRLRQFLLADPAGEAAMLMALDETIARCSAIVTYNGKSFDLPRLAMRYSLARLEHTATRLPHVDLLQLTRRLFAARLGSCRLADVERRLLKLKREDDVPGAAIPAVYLAYVTQGNARSLERGCRHNALDVLSLPATLAYLSRVAGEFRDTTVELHLALGRWDEERGRNDAAEQHYQSAWHLDSDANTGGDAVYRLTRLYHSRRQWDRCVEIWQEELSRASAGVRRVRALIELAKLYERQLRRPDEAFDLCAQAMAIVLDASPSMFVRTRPLLERQIERLKSRLGS